PDVLRLHPGMLGREQVERLVDDLAIRLRVLELLELRHPFVVLDSCRLQLGDLLALQLVELTPQDRVRILEDRLDEREDVERVRLAALRRPLVATTEDVEEVERERVVQREVLAEIRVDDGIATSIVVVLPLENARGAKGLHHLDGLTTEDALLRQPLVRRL